MADKLILLDTATGEEVIVETTRSAFYWAEGDGSCDCNRETEFGMDTVSNHCIGNERYLIIESTYEGYTLEELNEGYPEGLLQRHLAVMKAADRVAEELINGSPSDVEPVGILGSSK